MLVLSRKVNQTIRIGPDVEIVVVRIEGDKVRIGVRASDETPIWRGELTRDGMPESLLTIREREAETKGDESG